MLKKIISNMIGNVKVDTILSKDEFALGDPFEGEVVLKGGIREQEVRNIHIYLMRRFRVAKNRTEAYPCYSFTIPVNLIMKPGEKYRCPFRFMLPIYLPVTFSKREVWVQTDVEIPHAIDPTDKDYVKLNMSSFERILTTIMIERFGFRHGYVTHHGSAQKPYLYPGHPLASLYEKRDYPVVKSYYYDVEGRFAEKYRNVSIMIGNCTEQFDLYFKLLFKNDKSLYKRVFDELSEIDQKVVYLSLNFNTMENYDLIENKIRTLLEQEDKPYYMVNDR